MIETDVALIGAGPIGLEIAAGLKEKGVDYLHFEANQIGHTIQKWPRNTKFLSTPERDAIAGIPIQTFHQETLTGEEYLGYLRAVVETFDLPVRTYEEVTHIERSDGGFRFETKTPTDEHEYFARRVILATGDMAGPAYLDIPGESLPHVEHYFDDAHRYFRKRLLVVGGKNSALEAALRCWRAGADVTISYRGKEFDRRRVYSRLHLEVSILTGKGNIKFLPETLPVEIKPTEVILERLAASNSHDRLMRLPADFVLLCTGFKADMSLFLQLGVSLEGPDAEPSFDPQTMETNVPGVYVAGTAASGDRKRHRIFIATSHVHAERIVGAIAGSASERVGTIPARRYPFDDSDLETM